MWYSSTEFSRPDDRLQSANSHDLTHHKSNCQFECFNPDRFLPVSTASPNLAPSSSPNCLYLRWNIRPTRTLSVTSSLQLRRGRSPCKLPPDVYRYPRVLDQIDGERVWSCESGVATA
ncbi:hypothetical protein Y032_0206g1965 [Ancylostoma ceylanicum]|uniref:Uncharacterized protein n=1 Tax=Ancylostoma ceylanicum TaxID=53326 RepID=A0A016SM15_9BILA|nr:hypothetical protein Y032_0206g1965 [Ancylostoma ceylanicum]